MIARLTLLGLMTLLLAAPAVRAEEAAAKAEASAEKAAAPAKTAAEVLESQDLQMVFGKEDAPVTVIEYFSLSCPHCGEFYKTWQPKLMKDYVDTGTVRFVMRYFPHNGPGLAATMLMQCVAKEKQSQFLEALFNMQKKWAFDNDFKKSLKSIAEIGGVGPSDFDACLADKKLEDRILAQRQEALDVLKLEGIPAIFVNGVLVKDASYERMVESIQEELKAEQE